MSNFVFTGKVGENNKKMFYFQDYNYFAIITTVNCYILVIFWPQSNYILAKTFASASVPQSAVKSIAAHTHTHSSDVPHIPQTAKTIGRNHWRKVLQEEVIN